jgi:hypothetical protein
VVNIQLFRRAALPAAAAQVGHVRKATAYCCRILLFSYLLELY